MRSRLFASAAILSALIMAATTVGCSQSKPISFPSVDGPKATETSAGASATSTASVLGRETTITVSQLKARLEASGLKVAPVPYKNDGIFKPAKISVLNVDGNNVQVYKFRDAVQSLGAARTVDKDGFVVGYTPDQLISLNWAGWPAFFRSGDIIVVFITAKGADAKPARDKQIFKALVSILGEQFTGGQVAPPSLSGIETATVPATTAL